GVVRELPGGERGIVAECVFRGGAVRGLDTPRVQRQAPDQRHQPEQGDGNDGLRERGSAASDRGRRGHEMPSREKRYTPPASTGGAPLVRELYQARGVAAAFPATLWHNSATTAAMTGA